MSDTYVDEILKAVHVYEILQKNHFMHYTHFHKSLNQSDCFDEKVPKQMDKKYLRIAYSNKSLGPNL